MIDGHPNKGETLVHEFSAIMEVVGKKLLGHYTVSVIYWLLLGLRA